MDAKSTRNGVVLNVAQIEGAQPLVALVGAVEEAAVDAAVGLAFPLVGALDRELAVRQRLAGHLHAAEAARLQNRRQLDLCPVHLLHAADVLLAGEAIDIAVEEAAAEFYATARLDHLVAERAALAALADGRARCGHAKSLGMRDRGTKRFRPRSRRAPKAGRVRSGGVARLGPGSPRRSSASSRRRWSA